MNAEATIMLKNNKAELDKVLSEVFGHPVDTTSVMPIETAGKDRLYITATMIPPGADPELVRRRTTESMVRAHAIASEEKGADR